MQGSLHRLSGNVAGLHKRHVGSSKMSRQSAARLTRAVAAPDRENSIRMIDVDRSERDRLEQTDAFKELVQMNQKQSVNRPQQVTPCVHSPMSGCNCMLCKHCLACGQVSPFDPCICCDCAHLSVIEHARDLSRSSLQSGSARLLRRHVHCSVAITSPSPHLVVMPACPSDC